ATSTLRNMRARNGIDESKVVPSALRLPSGAMERVFDEAKPWFERLAKTTLLGSSTSQVRPPNSDVDLFSEPTIGTGEIYLPLEGLIDKAARAADLRAKVDKAR